MNLNDLLVELSEMIRNGLPLTERIRCRLVNKKWLFIVDQMNPKSFVFFFWSLQSPTPARWSLINEAIFDGGLLTDHFYRNILRKCPFLIMVIIEES